MDTTVCANGIRKTDAPAIFVAALLMFALSAIILSMSPVTHNFDEIKTMIFLISGPILMVAALALIAAHRVAAPSRGVALGLAAYLVVLLSSALNAHYKWAGWPQLFLAWSGAGFFMAALCAGSERRTSEILVRYFVVVILTVNIIGFLMFSFPGLPPQHSVLSWFFKELYPTGMGYSHFYMMLYMFRFLDEFLMSTFLGSDHYAFVCLFYFPFALLMALDPGPSRRPIFWRRLGLVAATTCAATIFYCQYAVFLFVWLIVFLLFGAVFYFVGSTPGSRQRARLDGVCSFLIALITVLYVLTPDLGENLRRHWFFFDARRILWAGALGIFRDHPWLGGGPGSFLILFPSYRSPDFHLHQISQITFSTQNCLLDLLAETALFGLAAFVLLLGALLVPAVRWVSSHRDVHTRGLMLAATTGVLGLLTASLLYTGSRLATGASSLWMGMGFLGGLLIQAQRSARPLVAGPTEGPLPGNGSPLIERPEAGALYRWISQAALWIALMILPSSISYSYHHFCSSVYLERGMVKMASFHGAIPKDSQARQKMARDLRKAEEEFEAAIACDPTLLTAYYKLGAVWTDLSQIEESQTLLAHYLEQARNAYERLAKLAPDYSDIHRSLALVYRLCYESAMRRASLSPTQIDLKEEAQGYAQLALDHMERMTQLSTQKEIALFHGDTAMVLRRYDRALAVLKAASDRYPDDKELAEKYLKVATEIGDTTATLQAKERFDRLLTTPKAADGTTSAPTRTK